LLDLKGDEVPAPTPTNEPTPVETPEPVDETPGPGPSEPGPDLDGDGNLDRWEYIGCFENPPRDEIDFDELPADDSLTLIVSRAYHPSVFLPVFRQCEALFVSEIVAVNPCCEFEIVF